MQTELGEARWNCGAFERYCIFKRLEIPIPFLEGFILSFLLWLVSLLLLWWINECCMMTREKSALTSLQAANSPPPHLFISGDWLTWLWKLIKKLNSRVQARLPLQKKKKPKNPDTIWQKLSAAFYALCLVITPERCGHEQICKEGIFHYILLETHIPFTCGKYCLKKTGKT